MDLQPFQDLSHWEQLGGPMWDAAPAVWAPEQRGAMVQCGTLPGGKALLCPKPGAQPIVGPLSPALVLGKAPAWSHLESHPKLEQITGANSPGRGILEVSRLKLFNLELKMQHCRAARFALFLLPESIQANYFAVRDTTGDRERNPLPGHSGDIPAIF